MSHGELGQTDVEGVRAKIKMTSLSINLVGDSFDEFRITGKNGTPLLRTPVIQDLVQSDFPSPGGKIGSRLKTGKMFPHGNPRGLQNILRILQNGDEGMNIGRQGMLMFVEKHEVFLRSGLST